MQNSLAKKIFAVGVAASTVLLSLAPLAAQAAAHPEGTNVLEADGTVGMIIGGQFRPYTSAGAFLSYGFNSWSGVATANADDLALPVGAFIPPQDGKVFCATATKGTDVKGECSLITGGQKAAFISAAVFTGQGFSFANAISGDSSFLSKTANVTNPNAAHLPGTLVHFVYNGHDTVFLVGSSGLLGVPDINTFNSWGYSFADAVQGNAADQAMAVTGVMAMRVAGQLSPTALASSGPNPTPTNPAVISGNVSASLSSDTPAAGTLVSGTSASQVGADIAHFTFTGSGTVTQIVVNRIGVSADASVNNVYLYMGNNRITDAGTFSNGMVTFSNSNGLFTVSGSAEVSIRIDVGTGSISGQTVGAQLTSFAVANGSPMSTSISGNLFSVASVSNLATVQVQGTGDSAVTGPGASINAGLTNQILWSVPISVGQRSVLLKYIAFKQIGSVPQSALQNLRLMIDGTQVGTTASITNQGSNTNVVVFDLTGSPVTLNTGGHTLALNGDIIESGTSFTFSFSLQQAADAVFYDTNYNVNVPITFNNSNTIFQLTPTTLTTVNSGSVSVQLDPSFTATQFVSNASQVVLGSWTMKAYGEDVKVQNLKVVLNYFLNGAATAPSSTSDGFNNLTLTVNGGGVGSSQSALYQTSGANFGGTGVNSFTFGTSNLFTIPAGTTVTVQVKGDSTFASNDYINSVRADLVTPQNALQGVTSFALSPSAGPITYSGVSLSTSTSNATLTKNSGYSNQTIGSNMTNQHIGSYVIQASSADGVRVTSLTVALSGSINPTTTLANLYIVTPAGNATPIQPAANSTFSTNFTVAANQTATVDVYADVSNATGTVTTSISGAGVGSTSNQAVTLTGGQGQTITVGNGTVLPPTLQTSSPVASFVIGGSTSQPAATFNFVASSGGAVIQELDFNSSSTLPIASGSPITSITVGGVTSPFVGASSSVTGLSIAVPTSFGGVDVPVTVNYAPVGQNGINLTGLSNVTFTLQLSRVKYLSGSTTAYLPVSGSYATNQKSSNLFDLVGSAPTVTLAQSTSRLTAATVIIGQVTVAANAAGNVMLEHMPITVSANNATITSSSVLAVDPSNGITAGTLGSFAVSNGGSATGTLDFTSGNDNNIAAGTSKTYNIEVTVSAVGNSTNGNPSVSLGLGSASLFTFKDVNGGADTVAGAVGSNTFLANYPTATVSIAP